jgi:hypothetical protein
MSNDNLALWRAVERTNPSHTKSFQGKGGFKGTAISPMWLILRATEQWGPMGKEWGIRIVTEKVVPGAPLLADDGKLLGHEAIHQVQAEVFYPGGAIPCFGQTQFIGRNKYGFFTDEEAPKKSLTDALTKGLSWLGFAADVHMGLFDDVKYVNRVRGEFEEAATKEAGNALRDRSMAVLEGAAKQGGRALDAAWKLLSVEARKACQVDMEPLTLLREQAKEVDEGAAA